MAFNTALGFLLCGIAMLTLIYDNRRISLVCASIAFVIGAISLLEYVTGLDAHIDQLLMRAYIRAGIEVPSRMSVATSICFVLAGLSLGFVNRRTVDDRSSFWISLLDQ